MHGFRQQAVDPVIVGLAVDMAPVHTAGDQGWYDPNARVRTPKGYAKLAGCLRLLHRAC